MDYTLPYLILIIIFSIISAFQIFIKFDKTSNNIFISLIGILFLVFFGLRGFIGWDWYNYFQTFKESKTIWDFFLNLKFSNEIGFSIYIALIKAFFPNYHFFIFISTLIDLFILHYFIKRFLPKNLYALAFTLYIVMGGIVLETDLMRNVKGLLLFLISIQYLEKRNLLKFTVINLVGLSFHWSSIIFFPLYFFLHRKINIKYFFVLFIIGNIIYLTQIEFVKPIVKFIANILGETAELKADLYLKSSIYSRSFGISIGYLERIGTSLLILLFYNQLIEKSKSNIIFINSFFIFFTITFFFSEVSIIIIRIANLFLFSYSIIWPQLIEISSKSLKYILFTLLSLYLCVKIVNMTDNVLYEYDNIISNDYKSYENRKLIFEHNADKLQKKK